MKFFRVRLLFTGVLSLICLMVFAQFNGGDGSVNNPWQIATPDHLNNIRDYLGENHSDKHFILNDNIDLNTPPYNEGNGWVPIGTDVNNSFRGGFDGNGLIILNLTINRANGMDKGLFGFTNRAVIKNVTLANINITADRYIGGLAARSTNFTTISNCSLDGSITGTGGAIGLLVGYHQNSNILSCSTSGRIISGSYGSNAVGGLVGHSLSDSNIINSFSTVNITGGRDNYDYGGLVGQNHSGSTILGCYAKGDVTVGTNTFYTGGLVGRNRSGSIISDCFSSGIIAANRDAGGFLGQNNQSQVIHCYSIGLVNNGTEGTNIGGFIGSIIIGDEYADNSNYWDTQSSSQAASAGSAQARTTQMMVYPYDENTYVDWNFTDIWGIDANANVNNGYPFPRWLRNPNPDIASNPYPADEAVDVPIIIDNLRWSYYVNNHYATPVGFRVYFNDTGEFEIDDEFDWIDYEEDQEVYVSVFFLPERFEFSTTYYWKVIPTTDYPERVNNSIIYEKPKTKHFSNQDRDGNIHKRFDAVLCPIWSFTTVGVSPHPDTASNPQPAHLKMGVSINLNKVSWDYNANPYFTNPVGFRVYLNSTGNFSTNSPYIWVSFDENEHNYTCSEIVTDMLDVETTYYWKVIPTTIFPNDRQTFSREGRESISIRGDAENCPTWRFRTGNTNIEDNIILPVQTELRRNYPNPFNPETTISFYLAEESHVSLKIFNIKGKLISTIMDTYLNFGEHNVLWTGTDNKGNKCQSGVYIYTLQCNNGFGLTYSRSLKLILLK